MPNPCQRRNQGLWASRSSCWRFAAARSLGVSGRVSGTAIICSSRSMSAMVCSTSIRHNMYQKAGGVKRLACFFGNGGHSGVAQNAGNCFTLQVMRAARYPQEVLKYEKSGWRRLRFGVACGDVLHKAIRFIAGWVRAGASKSENVRLSAGDL